MLQFDARELVNNFDVRIVIELLRLFFVRFEVVAAAKIVEMIEAKTFVVAEKFADFNDGVFVDSDPAVDGFRWCRPDDGFAESFQQDGMNFLNVHD